MSQPFIVGRVRGGAAVTVTPAGVTFVIAKFALFNLSGFSRALSMRRPRKKGGSFQAKLFQNEFFYTPLKSPGDYRKQLFSKKIISHTNSSQKKSSHYVCLGDKMLSHLFMTTNNKKILRPKYPETASGAFCRREF